MKEKKVKKVKASKKGKKISVFKVLSFIFVIYFVYTIFEQQIQLNRYDSRIEMYQADINTKKKLIDYYNNQKDNIKTDEYIESVAREVLGYVKPYEKIFIDANR